MPVTIQDPTVASWTPINMFAMIRALINNNVPILTNPGAPVSGPTGTFAGQAGPSTILFDYTDGVIYFNSGSLASPIWAALSGPASGASGLGSVGNAKMTYDFTVSGGAIGTLAPVGSPNMPLGAIIQNGVIDVTTIPVGAGASIGLGINFGAQVASLLAPAAISGAPWSTTGLKAIIPVGTAATAVKVTTAGPLTLTISGAPLTAGKFDVNVAYVIGN